MNFIKKIFSANNSDKLLVEETDIDFNLKRPGLIKYYFLASIRWIVSYWYITFPVIAVALLLGGTAGIQYIQGNDKPVWGTRTANLPMTSQLVEASNKITQNDKANYSHYRVYISGPEIHINIGLQTPDVTNYEEAQRLITTTYEKLIAMLPQEQQEKTRVSYSVIGIVAGVNPQATTTNLHAQKPKQSPKFHFYHG